MTRRRRWARRAALSALAGGGLTAAGLAGPLAGPLAAPTATDTNPVFPPVSQPAGTSGPSGPSGQSGGPSGQSGGPSGQSGGPSGQSGAPSGASGPTGSAGPTATPPSSPSVSGQRGQRVTTGPRSGTSTTKKAVKQAKKAKAKAKAKPQTPTGPNRVALPPQLIANQFGVLPGPLSGSGVAAAALAYYRIPLFLLPIYQAAGIQYGVPWQVLAAINEVETDYGRDLSVSSAGALGWMQFLPQTWLQYGVDANRRGYADPYNPADAVFAAARYLRAAGAQTNLAAGIFAYNHSTAYVDSVLLRARLIASYPESVIASLTGLTEGRLPVAGAQVAPGSSSLPTASSATAQSVAVPGSTPAPPPNATQASTTAIASRAVTLIARPGAAVVAVQDGRVVDIGHRQALGNYLTLRDVYGDVFIYAGLGTLAARYTTPVVPPSVATPRAGAPEAEPAANPTVKPSASVGRPVTLHVRLPRHPAAASALPPPGQVRLFAHPAGVPAAAQAPVATFATAPHGRRWVALGRGSLVNAGTVLGHLRSQPGATSSRLRFAIRPAGDLQAIDAAPIITNWRLLAQAVAAPHTGSGSAGLLGATAGDVFLLSKAELERAVLADPGISIYACGRQDIASGAIDRRVLAVLAFLSRSGLKPTVSALRCGHSQLTTSGAVSEHYYGDAVDISAINGIPILGHQGAGTITDATIRALLTLQGDFIPHQISSLMSYPGTTNTLTLASDYDQIHVGFLPLSFQVSGGPAVAKAGMHGKAAPVTALDPGSLTATQWDQLVARIAALPIPSVGTAPSSAAIRDPQAAPGNQGLGTLPPA